jgi:hypothetical protein
VLDVQLVANSTLVGSFNGGAVDGWSVGLGSNSGVGILDGFLLSHENARRTTERPAKVESPSLLFLRALGLVVEGLEYMD